MKNRIAIIMLALVLAGAAFAFLASQAAADDELSSPRLQALKREIEAGNRAALESFWQEMAKQTTPLIEPVTDDTHYRLVTFVWRAKEETRHVVIFGGAGGFDVSKNHLARLLDTDLWFRTYKIRSDARFTYSLSPNDSLVPFRDLKPGDMKAMVQRVSTFKPDPFNPHKMSQGLLTSSLAELPDAPPQPYTIKRADAPVGKVEEKKIKSAILNNERKAWVYTPPSYQTSGKPYGLLVIFDGMAYIALVPTPIILDNLIAEAKIPPLVAVIIDNPTQTSRNVELPCHAPFADFLAKELVPWMRQNYHVTADPKQTVVAGSSYGGLASMWAGFRHSKVFGNVLSQSGSYWWRPEDNPEGEHEWLTRQVGASPRLPLKIYMDVGLMEIGPTPGDGPTMVVTNRHLRDILRIKGYAVQYAEFNGGHEYLNWRGTLSDGLIYLLGQTNAKGRAKAK